MATTTNLDKWLYLVRQIEEHREEKAVKELQKLYKKLIKDLRGKMGNLYADYADPETGKLTYEALHRQGLDARLLEEVTANVASVTADESRIIRETVEQTYANCYSGMVQAVQNAVDNEELHEAFAAVEAVKPEVIKAAVNNPVHGLTLSDQLEKNRADIIWGIKQAVGVGLSEGDRYSTMARRIQKELIGPDGAGGSYYKAVRIARTEAHRVREEGNLDAAQNITEQLEPAGITMMKTWHTMKDERVRPSRSRKTKDGWKYSKSGKYDHQKMEGVQVPIKDDFTLPSGAKAQAPGKSGVAGEDINCRCFLSYDVVYDGFGEIKEVKIESIEYREEDSFSRIKVIPEGTKDRDPKNRFDDLPEDPQERTKALNTILNDYCKRWSKWKGVVNIVSDEELPDAWGQAEPDGSISLRRSAKIKTYIHELLHFRSSRHFSYEQYLNNKSIEEGTVELFAQELCRANGIEFYMSYQNETKHLRIINSIINPRGRDGIFDFARELFDIPLPQRYNYLRRKIKVARDSGAISIKSFHEANRQLVELQKGE